MLSGSTLFDGYLDPGHGSIKQHDDTRLSVVRIGDQRFRTVFA